MVKFKCRYPVWLLASVIVVPIIQLYVAIERAAGEEFGWWFVVSVTTPFLIAAMFGYGIWNREKRPVVEVGDDAISYGSVFQAVRRRVGVEDVAEVVPDDRNLVLRLRSGTNRKISLFEVAKAERDAARQAITDAVDRGHATG